MSESGCTPIEVYLQGGLGNQLFGLAAGWWAASMLNTSLVLSYRYLQAPRPHPALRPDLLSWDIAPLPGHQTIVFDAHQLPRPLARMSLKTARLITQMSGSSYVSPTFGHDPHLQTAIRPGKRIHGYFQTYKYAQAAQLQGFQVAPPAMPSDELGKAKEFIQDNNAIVIHVRRNDYVRYRDTIGVLGLEYYCEVVSTFIELGASPIAVIVGDDTTSMCLSLRRRMPKICVLQANEFQGVKGASMDFDLIKSAPFLGIANSSFSWWAAYLGTHRAVIAPGHWFRGLKASETCPPQWIQLDPRFEGSD